MIYWLSFSPSDRGLGAVTLTSMEDQAMRPIHFRSSNFFPTTMKMRMSLDLDVIYCYICFRCISFRIFIVDLRQDLMLHRLNHLLIHML